MTHAPSPRERLARSDLRNLSLRRLWALNRKEVRQILRDPSSIAMGVVLPLVLILLFGFGLSLDVKNVPVAVVMGDSSPEAHELAAGFQLSPYFSTRIVRTEADAEALMLAGKVNGFVRIPDDFARRIAAGDAQVQLIVDGRDANTARIIQGYAQGALGAFIQREAAEGKVLAGGPTVDVQSQMWFNAENNSRFFLIPGLIVLVMTLIGALLTSMVVAREWERGTLEALFVTPVRSLEIMLGKTLPYFALGMMGLFSCVLASQFLFGVPIRGSMIVLVAVSVLYVMVALGIGLVISSAVKSQLIASQLTLLATFMPAFMLSGFLFDLRSMPTAVRVITYALPARYYVALLQTVFLAGDVWSVILPNSAVLAAMALVLFVLGRAVNRKALA